MLNGGSGAGASSSSGFVDEDYLDSPGTPPGYYSFPTDQPPPEWEEVGAKKKARKAASAAKKDGTPAEPPVVTPTDTPAASTPSTAKGKKPAASSGAGASSSSASKGSKAKAVASPAAAATPAAAAPVAADPPSVGSTASEAKRTPKKPKEVTKAELQSRCEALLALHAPETGFMGVEKLGAALAEDMGVSSWEAKYSKAHGPLRSFLARCPNLSAATVGHEDRVYLNKALDATARAAIAAEKAGKITPRKRKSAAARGGCCRMLLRLETWLFIIGIANAVVVFLLVALIPSEEWRGGMAAVARGDGELTYAFIRRAANTLTHAADGYLADLELGSRALAVQAQLQATFAPLQARVATALGR